MRAVSANQNDCRENQRKAAIKLRRDIERGNHCAVNKIFSDNPAPNGAQRAARRIKIISFKEQKRKWKTLTK
jgi:hypothetical protein